MDAAMPVLDGITATRMIRAELEDTQVIIMTGVNADASAIESTGLAPSPTCTRARGSTICCGRSAMRVRDR